jgi:hypothetical protein
MGVNTAGGVRFFIGSPQADPADIQLADMEADSYVEIGEVEDGGQLGDESQAITFTALKDARVRKFKGPKDAGTIALVCGADTTDEGQDALVAAEGTPLDYNFKAVLNDQLTLSGSGTELYFAGKVMSKRRNIGNVSNVVRYTFNIGVNSPILEVEAT